MKNSKLVNVVLVVIIGLTMMFVAKESLAATDLTNTLTGNNTTNNSNIQTITGNSTTNNTTSNKTTNNAVLTTNNTSTYNNTSLPKTGAGDVVPGIVLVVVLGIIAIQCIQENPVTGIASKSSITKA